MKNFVIIVTLFWAACSPTPPNNTQKPIINGKDTVSPVFVEVLGIAQDGGAPHLGCQKTCCKNKWNTPELHRWVVSLGLFNSLDSQTYIFEATPDFTEQLAFFNTEVGRANLPPNGIFITHAHIGHYTGLMHLGREVAGTDSVPVFCMPKFSSFLQKNGPWSQLVALGNIKIEPLIHEVPVQLHSQLSVTPLLVPHRDEYSETVGFVIEGPKKSLLFIPDIDKWSKWEKNILKIISQVDYALLDATFYDGEELNTRDISEIPHPFVIESMELFKSLPENEKDKIHFIHFNHTNPLIDTHSKQQKTVTVAGFKLAYRGMKLGL